MNRLAIAAVALVIVRLAAGSWRGVALYAVTLVVAFGIGAGIVTANPEWTQTPRAVEQ